MKIEINIPDLKNFEYNEHDIKMFIGVMLYEKDILCTSHCAQSIGMSRADFIKKMGKYGQSIFDVSVEQFEKDLINA